MGLPCTHQEDIVMGICYNHQGSTSEFTFSLESTEVQPETFIGLILGGAERTKINGLNMAQESNVVIGFCGHIGLIVTSSNIVKTENLGSARQFDVVIGEGVVANIMSGSENIFAG